MALLGMEQQQLACFRDVFEARHTALFPESDELKAVLEAALDSQIWEDHSGKGDLPPDLLCPSANLMMEVMGIDDHAHKGRKKLVNPYKERESALTREIADSGVLNMLPEVQRLFVSAATSLPTAEDHCYAFYLEEFKRVLHKHAVKVPQYHMNHPRNKLVFLVFDNSSGSYLQVADGLPMPSTVFEGLAVQGKSHLFWADVAFQEAIYSCGADYLIWCTPWKHAWDAQGRQIPFPKACVYNLSYRVAPSIRYAAERMVSSEI